MTNHEANVKKNTEWPRGAIGERKRAHRSFKPGVMGSSPIGATGNALIV